jgi:hypothetical protein
LVSLFLYILFNNSFFFHFFSLVFSFHFLQFIFQFLHLCFKLWKCFSKAKNLQDKTRRKNRFILFVKVAKLQKKMKTKITRSKFSICSPYVQITCTKEIHKMESYWWALRVFICLDSIHQIQNPTNTYENKSNPKIITPTKPPNLPFMNKHQKQWKNPTTWHPQLPTTQPKTFNILMKSKIFTLDLHPFHSSPPNLLLCICYKQGMQVNKWS